MGIYSRTWGSAKHDKAEGVHRPLLGSALVLRETNGGNELVFLALDTIVLDSAETANIRAKLVDELVIRPDQLIIHPSHSHSAPWLLRKRKDRPGGHLIEPYLDALPGILIDLVQKARADAGPAILSFAYGRAAASRITATRWMPPAGATSAASTCPNRPTIPCWWAASLAPATALLKPQWSIMPCHPVSLGGGNRLISPDYIGAMREVMERDTGGAPCIFLHGASGDLTPRRSYEAVPEAADQNGRELGYAAMSVLSAMFPPGQQLQYQGIEEIRHTAGHLAADKEA